VVPAGQLSEPKLELQLSHRDKTASGSERNSKLQAPPDLKIGPNKFQIKISKSQTKSKANCLVRRRRIDHCDLPFDLAQGGESFDFAQDREPVERLVEPFGICYFLFFKC